MIFIWIYLFMCLLTIHASTLAISHFLHILLRLGFYLLVICLFQGFFFNILGKSPLCCKHFLPGLPLLFIFLMLVEKLSRRRPDWELLSLAIFAVGVPLPFCSVSGYKLPFFDKFVSYLFVHSISSPSCWIRGIIFNWLFCLSFGTS